MSSSNNDNDNNKSSNREDLSRNVNGKLKHFIYFHCCCCCCCFVYFLILFYLPKVKRWNCKFFHGKSFCRNVFCWIFLAYLVQTRQIFRSFHNSNTMVNCINLCSDASLQLSEKGRKKIFFSYKNKMESFILLAHRSIRFWEKKNEHNKQMHRKKRRWTKKVFRC